jgi:hypothetical protein
MPVPSSKLRLALADGRPRQVLLFLAAYLVYGASRWVMTGDEASALEHAHSIVELEEASGVAVKASVQQALEGTAGLWLLNNAYLAAQVGVVPAALIWFYRRLSYRRLRDTVAGHLAARPAGVLAAPGRPTPAGRARHRRHDHPADRPGARLQTHHQLLQPPRRRPVLHCGFALAVSLALAGSARRRWTRALALAWAPTIFLAVVATGNHFVFDIAAGITATGLGFGVARLVAGRRRAGRRRPAWRTGAPPALAPGGGRLG